MCVFIYMFLRCVLGMPVSFVRSQMLNAVGVKKKHTRSHQQLLFVWCLAQTVFLSTNHIGSDPLASTRCAKSYGLWQPQPPATHICPCQKAEASAAKLSVCWQHLSLCWARAGSTVMKSDHTHLTMNLTRKQCANNDFFFFFTLQWL